MMDMVSKIMTYESGEMTEPDEVIEFFQALIDTGTIWHLQGSYQRAAQRGIERGELTYRGIRPGAKFEGIAERHIDHY